jgi:hypothetical protein
MQLYVYYEAYQLDNVRQARHYRVGNNALLPEQRNSLLHLCTDCHVIFQSHAEAQVPMSGPIAFHCDPG